MVWCKTPQPSAPGVGAFETDGVGVWHQHQLRIILFFEITSEKDDSVIRKFIKYEKTVIEKLTHSAHVVHWVLLYDTMSSLARLVN